MIWDQKHETLKRDDMSKLQAEKLRRVCERVYHNVPFYRQAFDTAKVKPEDIKTIDDIRRLPFTTKIDLRDSYPYNMFAAPMEDIIRIHASSGTTGKPTVVGYTRKDVADWADMMARCMTAAGVTKNDIVQNAYGYGLFTGGLGAHYGAERIGAAVVPISGGNTQKQIMLLQDFGSTVLTATPSFVLYIYDVAREMGVDIDALQLRVGILGAEPWSDQMRQEIEAKMKIKAVDIFGLSEITGPGVSCECVEAQNGLHVNEDYFYPEIIDPDTGEQLPWGEKGELVITTLEKEGIPLIRYRIKDISSLNPEPCVCGRTLVRMARVSGRNDDMLIIRGVNVFPSQIESVLLMNREVEPHYQLVIERQGSMDTLEIQVEVTPEIFKQAENAMLSADEKKVFNEYEDLASLRKKIQGDVKDIIGVTTSVVFKEPGSIARSEGKAKRVIDKR
ncbi:MAG: phenylacetate--CoA ligase [Deltaproteobacteria bacterium]|nr:phenylacetate--CoA ligase [Candidatus Anaeroferrophillacea bacterium]